MSRATALPGAVLALCTLAVLTRAAWGAAPVALPPAAWAGPPAPPPALTAAAGQGGQGAVVATAAPEAGSVPAEAGEAALEEVRQLAEQRWEELETAEVLRFVRELQQQSGGRLPALGTDVVRSILRGEGVPVSARDVLAAAGAALFGAIAANAGLLGRLVLLAVLLAVLHLLQTAFENEAVAAAADTAVYLAMAALGLVAFHEAIQLVGGVVRDLVDFMLAMLPTLVTLLAGVGAFLSAGLLSPASVMLVNGVGVVASTWVLPLIFLGTVLQVVDHLPGRVRVGRLAALVRQAGVMLMSLAFIVFLGVMSVQGAAAGVADGVLLRTAKFGAGTFIPVLGRMFADAAELVIGSSLLLKNAAGIFGLVMVLMLAAFPLLKVLALIVVFRLAAALVQPIADGPFVQALTAMSDGLVLAGVTAAAVAMMFFFALTVLLGVGNLAVMLR